MFNYQNYDAGICIKNVHPPSSKRKGKRQSQTTIIT